MSIDRFRRRVALEAARLIYTREETQYARAKMKAARQFTSGQIRPGDLPDNREIPVHVSVTFTWDKREGERLAKSWSRFYDDVAIGGPAYNDPGGEFVPGQYMKTGVTITSRGCPKRCDGGPDQDWWRKGH